MKTPMMVFVALPMAGSLLLSHRPILGPSIFAAEKKQINFLAPRRCNVVVVVVCLTVTFLVLKVLAVKICL